jgi:heptosyltransferase-2
VDEVIPFGHRRYDSLAGALSPSSMMVALRLGGELRRRNYDVLVLLHHLTTRWGALKYAALALVSGASVRAGLDNGRGWFLTHKTADEGFGHIHEILYCLRVAGLLGASEENARMEVPILPEERGWAEEQLPGGGSWVAIHPGTGTFSQTRRWPTGNFAEVADELAERGARIVLVGGRREEDLGRSVEAAMTRPAISLIGQTTLGQLAAVLERAELFVGNDSGVMHMAVAVGTPVVAIFGPSNARAWGPYPFVENPVGRVVDARNVVIRSDLPCSPCLYRGRNLGLREGCAERPCMLNVTPGDVMDGVEALGGRIEWGE